jgi:tetratricopeptide (TPR) repeat protein
MKRTFLLLTIYLLASCTAKLDLKPNNSIVTPKTVKDLELILENTEIMNATPVLAQISADEYFIPSIQEWQALSTSTARNAYIWNKDIYEGETKIADFNRPFSAIFYCNNILDVLSTQDVNLDNDKKVLKGWALFARSYALYSLVSIFSKGYDPASAFTDLGVPIKLTAGIDEIIQRSSVQQTYDQITKDALEASELLQDGIIWGQRNRPSKVAAFAFLARVYLSMGKFDQAELFADKALSIYSTLTDFNTLNKTSPTPFTLDSEEIIYYTHQSADYAETAYAWISTSYGVDPELIELYDPADLRLTLYFQKNTLGNYNLKPINTLHVVQFTGLATDEIYLIKSECLARRGQTLPSLDILNKLVQSRWDKDINPYEKITANSPEAALNMVLLERRKALVWRSIRWTDLKRLNIEGRAIQLSRTLGNKTYTLEPNGSRYVLPIPQDEIALSGIQQNKRD